MQALGLIETRGLLPAIECADVMLKTAQVELVGRDFVGGGLVTISVTGDVGAVKAAVEAGAVAVEKISPLLLVSQHVIPRPHQEIEGMISPSPAAKQAPPVSQPEKVKDLPGFDQTTNKQTIDDFVQEFGLEPCVDALKSLPVLKLRNLAREYKGLAIAGRAISKANKEDLIQQLKEYYNRKHE
ncbi:BMC domain-containing protein [Desulfitobacterium chlororespirans]|uniref:BMC domain-containing protein n=1 Tax=Desulfitobacterium chlororespirans DSM 11544 TaxID=1121395 RepID=A0A1M7TEK6_9FIRM|nr:BMC domain-containing protein [Desulfitobacterium chlororespirans]SHN69107.1 BMC domain-containing protein [Desulfitobacterium chlororespirans DSM 11544]